MSRPEPNLSEHRKDWLRESLTSDDGNEKTLSIGQCASLACLLEVTAPKAGNVHRSADFADLTFLDFAASAVAIGPVMDAAPANGLGATVWSAIQATREVVSTNTNLGTVLLLAPLATAADASDAPDLRNGVRQVLSQLDASDAEQVYAAIRLAEPGGMGEVPDNDVFAAPPCDLVSAMAQTANRDMVARQYVNGFQEVLDAAVVWIVEAQLQGWSLTEAIVLTQLRLLSEFPDSLIARKCGEKTARESAARAGSALTMAEGGKEDFWPAVGELDFWLRADGNRRNPGTTADLIAAALFVGLRYHLIRPPFR